MNKKILHDINFTNTALWRILSSFSQQLINTPVDEGSWTAAQVAAHLFQSDSMISKTLLQSGNPAGRPPDERIEEIKDLFLNFTIKMTSPKEIVPENKNYNKEKLINSLTGSRVKINDIIRTMNLSEICVDPIFGEITRLELIYFVKYHTERHIHQLSKIHTGLTKKASANLSL